MARPQQMSNKGKICLCQIYFIGLGYFNGKCYSQVEIEVDDAGAVLTN